MGYYFPAADGHHMPVSAIRWSALTHVAMVGGNPNSDGSITLSSGFSSDATALISAAHANGVKVLYVLSNLGGGTNFTGAASSGNLSTFIANITSTVNTYGFDGVDIDWEEAWNTTEITNLASGLRTALGTRILTATNISVGNVNCNTGGTWTPAMVGYLDRIEIMDYDSNGSWNTETWFNAPLYSANSSLYSVDSDVRGARSCGYDMAKVSIGIPFYGYLTTPSNGPYQSFGASPSLTQMYYYNIVATYGVTSYTFDTTAHEPWRALTGTSWIQWDNEQAITDKINYVQANNLGGWVIWTLDYGYISGATPQDPLLDAIGKASASRPQPPTGLQIISVK
jgi:chitinase